ncbi:DUF2202 domain-containing protein [Demequina sp. NBRC 110052]|uniref:DUF2202 domain-containing protein n=1 Tax=Demequina sp. NBRC 110052 TaxID=1570341 RepID=UPI0013566B1D|nr:DUF2202 domain-containing protein [Demequina sp. NBRC 110052]
MRTTRMTAAAVAGAIGLVTIGAGAALAAPGAGGHGFGAGDGSGDRTMDRLHDAGRDRDRDGECDGSMMRDRDGSAVLDLADGELSDADAASLAYMVQEEKLAHDLYVTLGETHDLRILDRIALAEVRHADAVRALLEAYGLEDPTLGLEVGEFADDDLQQLYDSLLAQGLKSEEAALTVGGIVEETDIADLSAADTGEASIDALYYRLETGSTHHLVAFVKVLDARGVDYETQVLTDAQLAAIVDGS